MSTRTPAKDAHSTSSSLISRVRRQEPAAWARLSELYGPLVYHWCRRTGLAAEDAADVVQEVFRAVSIAITSFHDDRDGDTFRGWLWTITRNKIRDFARYQHGKPQAAGGTAAHAQLIEVPDREPDTEEGSPTSPPVNRLIHRALEMIRTEFQESTWNAFRLTALEGCSAPQAAKELGSTPQAVRQAKSRVLRRLRAELGELE
ncbi:RNA polymerase sigma factor CnrH [Symmachiella dynata]|uniref:RNA polymerase sigma factor n=1 Tax=Symmachiella dynata TaxID=2527995 RepID=UPI00118ACCCA|nr:sigma-70 family RNA polymerase sigma factor [Symmachiella dynata]QDT47359.1 RNA polymerase sigma factor CnrH [Symmachiella dynata]